MFVRQSCFSDPHVPLRNGPKFRLEMLEKRTTCFQMTSPATSFAAFLTAFQPSWNTPQCTFHRRRPLGPLQTASTAVPTDPLSMVWLRYTCWVGS